jgi:hypothetical protein
MFDNSVLTEKCSSLLNDKMINFEPMINVHIQWMIKIAYKVYQVFKQAQFDLVVSLPMLSLNLGYTLYQNKQQTKIRQNNPSRVSVLR